MLGGPLASLSLQRTFPDGRTDILVNCAGYLAVTHAFETHAPQDWEAVRNSEMCKSRARSGSRQGACKLVTRELRKQMDFELQGRRETAATVCNATCASVLSCAHDR